MTDLVGRLKSWRRKSLPASEPTAIWRVRVERERGAIGKLNDRLESELMPEVPERVVRALQVVFDELLTNVIMHAEQAAGPIEIELRRLPQTLEVSVVYIAAEFDPTGWKSSDSGATIAQSSIGGLGIHLVRTLMDEFHHEYVDGRNVVELKKRC